ncbi:MAG: tautomerase family protein [Bacteroidales bacterium]
MPAVKIELQKGRDLRQLLEMKNAVLKALVESLKLPQNDQNIRIMEYEKDLFQMKPPYEILIEISMFEGRTKETKKLLYSNIVGALQQKCNIAGEKVLIILNEQPLRNWGVRGGYPADEIDLGFKVKV